MAVVEVPEGTHLEVLVDQVCLLVAGLQAQQLLRQEEVQLVPQLEKLPTLAMAEMVG